MSDKRVDQFSLVQKEALELFLKKNADYGDAFANYGPVGVIVRMGDKIQRYVSVSNSNVSLVNTESLRDTLIDLHNYAAMAIMLMDEEKKCINFIKNNRDEERREKARDSNKKRVQLTPIEDGLDFLKMQNEGLSIRDIAQKENKDKNHVAARLNLTKFDSLKQKQYKVYDKLPFLV